MLMAMSEHGTCSYGTGSLCSELCMSGLLIVLSNPVDPSYRLLPKVAYYTDTIVYTEELHLT